MKKFCLISDNPRPQIEIYTECTAMATSDKFIWKELMERSLLYLTGETINLHEDKTETQNPDVHLKAFFHVGEPV